MPYRPETYVMPDGSAAAPGMAFEDEPTTGFYRKSAGVVGRTRLYVMYAVPTATAAVKT
jgi:hypothetical protein